MIYTLLLGLVFLSFFVGYYLREVIGILLNIKNTIQSLKVAQEGTKPSGTTFAGPMSRAEVAALIEQEKIDILNNR